MTRRAATAGCLALWLCTLASLAAARDPEGPSRRERRQWASEARALMDRKEFEAAARLLEKAAAPGARAADLAEWWPLLGRCHENAKNYQKALNAYQEAHRLEPKNLDRKLDLARVYALVDLNAQAIDLYQEVLKRDRHRKDVVLALGRLYHRAGRMEEARDMAERYLRWEPRDPAAQELMARIEEALGDLSGAAHRWEGLLALSPSADGYFYLGRLWSRQNQFDLAERAFQKAEALGLDSAVFRVEQGVLAWRRGDDAAASLRWRKTLEAHPALDLARFLAALMDHKQGKTAQALEGMARVEKETESDYLKDLARRFQTAAQNRTPSADSPRGGGNP